MLPIQLKGKKAFIAGVGDDQGFAWAISKALIEAGADVYLGIWPPIFKIFKSSLKQGKFDASRKLSDGSLLEFKGLYPLDVTFDSPEDVPEEVRINKRYALYPYYTLQEVAEHVTQEHGKMDLLIHSVANAPEVKKPLIETSRKGYLSAISSSSYSLIGLVQAFGPHMNTNGSVITLTYLAAERTIPGYGGGMSSAKAALESDVRTLSYEAGEKWGLRINAVSAGPLPSRAAKAIGFIEKMIEYSEANAPLTRHSLSAEDVGNTCAFLLSPLAQAITGTTIHVDHGLHSMGVSLDSPAFSKK